MTELVAPPGPGAPGRVFEQAIRPGVADGVGSGRVRLDAIARWLQDVAYLDLVDAGFEEKGVWIVRRTRLRVESFPRFGDELVLSTFCSGIGRFSAERRTTVSGGSASVEAVALWIWLDGESLRPARFPPEFTEIYGASANGREAGVRLRHPDPPADAERKSWLFRASDVDVAGHVNNSHHWAALEQELVGDEPLSLDAEVEYRDPALPGEAVLLRDRSARWIAAADGRVCASILGGPGLR